MTNTAAQSFSDSSNQPETPNAKKLKTLQHESAHRAKRIAKILSAALQETIAEVKAGKAVISPIAKEVSAETVATVKEKSYQATETINQAWQQEAHETDRTERIIRVVRALSQKTAKNLLPTLKVQARKLDTLLGNTVDKKLQQRYGQRYETIKGKFASIRTWYGASEQPITEVSADGTSSISVKSEVIG
jgi:hypothetical protein